MSIDKAFKWNTIYGVFVRGFGALGGVLVSLVLTKLLEPNDVGTFFFILSFIYISISICKVGLEGVVARTVAIDFEAGRGLDILLIKFVLFTISLICISIFLVMYFVVQYYELLSADFESSFAYIFIAVLFLSLSGVFAMALQGLKKSTMSIFILNVSVNMIFLAMLFLFDDIDLKHAISAFSISCVVTFFVSCFFLRNSITRYKKSINHKAIFENCLPLWTVSIMTQLILWFGQFYAGKVATSEEVAYLAISQRVAMIASMLLLVVNVVVAPRFANHYSKAEFSELKLLASSSINLVFFISAPAFILCLLFPKFILGLFGSAYVAAETVFLILLIGQFVNVCTGSVGVALTMTGHGKDLRRSVMISAVVAVIAVVVLGEMYGVIGCAVATTSAVLVQNLSAVYLAKLRLGVMFLPLMRGFRLL